MSLRRLVGLALGLLMVAAGAGCERATVYGTVVDERGELLPGVIVTVARTREQDLSDAMGAYAISFEPRGAHTLHYVKTGFTPAVLDLEITEPRSVQAKVVEMWRVPPNPGVFALRNYRYDPLTPVEIESFPIQDAGTLYGTQRDAEYVTDNQAPVIIMHRMPTFDVRFARLEERPLATADGKPIKDAPEAWVLAEPLATDVTAIDQPEGLLQRLTFTVPLEPGVYAVHWGALHGYTATEKRIFLFRVLGPDEVVAPEVEGETTAEDDEAAANEDEAEADDEGSAVRNRATAVDDDGGF